jgi:hypothetical protein
MGRSVFVKLVIQKSGTEVRWVVEKSEAEIRSNEDSELKSEFEVPTLRTSRRIGQPGESQNAHFSQNQGEMGHPAQVLIPLLCACVDPAEKWWLRLRGNPKRAGGISQAAFLLKAEMLGFDLALPWGDNQKFDFVVWRRDGRAVRVQVKGTGRLHRRGYEVQPVHATRRGGKKRYTKKDIDVIAAHVQPVDAWYLIPIEKVGRAKSLRLYPGIERKRAARGRSTKVARWERWRDAWDVLAER